MENTQATEPKETQENALAAIDRSLDGLKESLIENTFKTNALLDRIASLEEIVADLIARNCLLMGPTKVKTADPLAHIEAGESHSSDDKA